jgi:hypothetical protein
MDGIFIAHYESSRCMHACKKEEEEEEWGKDFQLMNEILIAWEEVLWAFHPCLHQLIA